MRKSAGLYRLFLEAALELITCEMFFIRVPTPPQSLPTAGHIVGQQQLASYLERTLSLGPRNVVLFLQDKVHESYTRCWVFCWDKYKRLTWFVSTLPNGNQFIHTKTR